MSEEKVTDNDSPGDKTPSSPVAVSPKPTTPSSDSTRPFKSSAFSISSILSRPHVPATKRKHSESAPDSRPSPPAPAASASPGKEQEGLLPFKLGKHFAQQALHHAFTPAALLDGALPSKPVGWYPWFGGTPYLQLQFSDRKYIIHCVEVTVLNETNIYNLYTICGVVGLMRIQLKRLQILICTYTCTHKKCY